MTFPGLNKPDLFVDTQTNPDHAATVRKLITWRAHTDADERRLLSMLGLAREAS